MIFELLKQKLGKQLSNIWASFHFGPATSDEQWETFKKEFGIEASIPDYARGYKEIYETGEGEYKGMVINAFGPRHPNPDYHPQPKEVVETYYEAEYMKQQLTSISDLLWEAVAKDIVSFDREKMIALFKTRHTDWDYFYGLALKLFKKHSPENIKEEGK